METNSYIEPVYLISAVAEILNIHPQTLRQYEREGLIKPSRTNGKIIILPLISSSRTPAQFWPKS